MKYLFIDKQKSDVLVNTILYVMFHENKMIILFWDRYDNLFVSANEGVCVWVGWGGGRNW